MNDEPLHLLDHLPAIYRQTTQLEEFLRPFETRLRILEDVLDHIASYFTPEHTRDEFLPWLAGWVALNLDEDWTEKQRRDLIAKAAELYRRRGTVGGLEQYLKIFTKGLYTIAIHHPCWPAGMQIGVASRLPWFEDPKESPTCPDEPDFFDWYVVSEAKSGGGEKYFYRTDCVEQVEISGDSSGIQLWLDGQKEPNVHKDATIERRDHCIELCQVREQDNGTRRVYRGSTALISEIEWPYRFVVELREKRPLTEEESKKTLEKVRNIIDQEKPAHTLYQLRILRYQPRAPKPYEPRPTRPFLPIGDRQTPIGAPLDPNNNRK